MKCKKCPALKCEGYEYPEEYCSVGGDFECEWEWKDGEYGCKLHPNTVKKRLKENEEAFEKQYQDIGEWYIEQELNERLGINVSDPDGQYVIYAMHCIGLDYKQPYHRHGKAFYKPYRNHYDAGDTNEIWDTLVKIGHAYKKMMYHLTPEGFRWLGRILDVTIYPYE